LTPGVLKTYDSLSESTANFSVEYDSRFGDENYDYWSATPKPFPNGL